MFISRDLIGLGSRFREVGSLHVAQVSVAIEVQLPCCPVIAMGFRSKLGKCRAVWPVLARQVVVRSGCASDLFDLTGVISGEPTGTDGLVEGGRKLSISHLSRWIAGPRSEIRPRPLEMVELRQNNP